jgi:flagellar biogenesis protein FliO
MLETLVTLVVVCGLAFVVLWGARRLGIGRPMGPIQLRGHLPLDGRRAVYLVQVGAQVFVVGVAEGGFTKLGEMPASELPASAAAPTTTFTDVLGRVLARPAKKDEP